MDTNTYRVRLLASILDLDELAMVFDSRFGGSKTLADVAPTNVEAFNRDGTPTPAFTFYLKSIGDLEVATDKRYRLVDLTEAEIQWLDSELGYWAGWNADPAINDYDAEMVMRGLTLRGKRKSFERAARKAGFSGRLGQRSY